MNDKSDLKTRKTKGYIYVHLGNIRQKKMRIPNYRMAIREEIAETFWRRRQVSNSVI